MTPEQLAELFIEEQCDNTMNIHTCIEILIKNAYKAGYECAVDKACELIEKLCDSNNIVSIKDGMYKSRSWLEEQFRKAMQ